MMLQPIFERFVDGSPVTVMLRAILERTLPSAAIDQLFTDTAEQQYTRALLFSSVVDVMCQVVCRIRPSIHAAYQADPTPIGVSLRALYDKLAKVEPGTSAALVAHTAQQLKPLIERLRGGLPLLLSGYRVRILDGNHLAGTEHRLPELRTVAAGALPGQTLAVLDAETMLVTDVLCCEDGHAQERALLPEIVPLVAAQDIWVADRNFCTTDFWFALAWGAFPAFTGYFANALTVRPAGVLVAAACFLLSVAQRRLSTPARALRRRTAEITGTQRLADGRVVELTAARLAEPLEGALSALWLALLLLAAGLVAVRL